MPSIAKSATQYTTLEKRYDSDGKVWLQVQAHAALVAKTPYEVIVNEFGYITAALADNTNQFYVGVPEAAVTSGDVAWIQIGGYCEDVITPSLSISVGHAVAIHNGVIADNAADYSGVTDEFAVCTTASSSSETQDLMLIPEMITNGHS